MTGYLYILHSTSAGHHYVGSATNLQRRLKEHKSGRVRSTKGNKDWRLLTTVKFSTAHEARRAESWLKRMRKTALLEAIVENAFTWPDDLQPVDDQVDTPQ